MKNLIKISITTLGTLAILGTSTLAVTGIVNAPSGLVLREQANKTGNPITTVPDKTEVDIIEESGEWYKVTYNSQEGYLYAEYVNSIDDSSAQETEKPTTSEEQQPTTDNTNNVQAENKLKVYNIPLITSTVINEIEPNAEITIIKQITNWSYVSVGNIQGWVRTYGIQGTVQTETPVEPSEEANKKPEETTPKQEEQPTEPTVTEPEQPVTEEPEQETVSQPSNTTQTETSSTATKGFVAVGSATVRAQATKESAVVTYLTKDTSFTITAETEEWYKIKYTGLDGTVYEGYIYNPLVTI